MFAICDVLSVHLLGGTATGVIARFCGSLAALLLLAECSLRRRRPCRARLHTHVQTVSQAVSMLTEFPATPLPESRKNSHSHPSN